MKIAVLGATGQTGQELVQQALQQGHTVTAIVRNPAKLTVTHDNLKVLSSRPSESSVYNVLEYVYAQLLDTLQDKIQSQMDLNFYTLLCSSLQTQHFYILRLE